MKAAKLPHADALQRGLMDIGQASRASGVSVKRLRHYEAIGLLPQVGRTLGNYRVYSMSDVHTLRFIKRARALGFSMENIRELLGLWQDRSRSSAAVKRMVGKQIEALKRKRHDLEAMVDTLQQIARSSHGEHHPGRSSPGGLAKSPFP